MSTKSILITVLVAACTGIVGFLIGRTQTLAETKAIVEAAAQRFSESLDQSNKADLLTKPIEIYPTQIEQLHSAIQEKQEHDEQIEPSLNESIEPSPTDKAIEASVLPTVESSVDPSTDKSNETSVVPKTDGITQQVPEKIVEPKVSQEIVPSDDDKPKPILDAEASPDSVNNEANVSERKNDKLNFDQEYRTKDLAVSIGSIETVNLNKPTGPFGIGDKDPVWGLRIKLKVSNLTERRVMRTSGGGFFAKILEVEDDVGNELDEIDFQSDQFFDTDDVKFIGQKILPNTTVEDWLVVEVPLEKTQFLTLNVRLSRFDSSLWGRVSFKIPIDAIKKEGVRPNETNEREFNEEYRTENVTIAIDSADFVDAPKMGFMFATDESTPSLRIKFRVSNLTDHEINPAHGLDFVGESGVFDEQGKPLDGKSVTSNFGGNEHLGEQIAPKTTVKDTRCVVAPSEGTRFLVVTEKLRRFDETLSGYVSFRIPIEAIKKYINEFEFNEEYRSEKLAVAIESMEFLDAQIGSSNVCIPILKIKLKLTNLSGVAIDPVSDVYSQVAVVDEKNNELRRVNQLLVVSKVSPKKIPVGAFATDNICVTAPADNAKSLTLKAKIRPTAKSVDNISFRIPVEAIQKKESVDDEGKTKVLDFDQEYRTNDVAVSIQGIEAVTSPNGKCLRITYSLNNLSETKTLTPSPSRGMRVYDDAGDQLSHANPQFGKSLSDELLPKSSDLGTLCVVMPNRKARFLIWHVKLSAFDTRLENEVSFRIPIEAIKKEDDVQAVK